MPSNCYSWSSRPVARGGAALALLGGAASLGFASPAAAHVVPAQAPAVAGPFNVSLVLPPSNTAKSAQTAEQLSGFSLSTTASASSAGSSGLGAGKNGAGASQATATMPIDATSTNLLRDVLVSQVLNPLEVVFSRTSGGKQETFLTYDFKNCTITSYQLQYGPGSQPQEASGSPSVQFTFVFQGITLAYGTGASSLGTGGVGTVPASWSITTNKAV